MGEERSPVNQANICPTEQKESQEDTRASEQVITGPSSPIENIQTKLDSDKVVVIFKNVANAPILKQSKFKVSTSKTVASMIELLRKAATGKIDIGQSVFIYINQSFAPSLDQTVQNLFDCYACDNKLVLHYAITTAWG